MKRSTDAALEASPALRELVALARSRLHGYSAAESRQMLAACLLETLEAIDTGSIRFQDAEAKGTLNALLLVAIDQLLRDDVDSRSAW